MTPVFSKKSYLSILRVNGNLSMPDHVFAYLVSFSRHYEVVEVYRRMLFAAALPILAPQGLPRAALGCVLAILAVTKGVHAIRVDISIDYLPWILDVAHWSYAYAYMGLLIDIW